jgi:2-polyprenyl-6-methoxyphenol hydroxylase-like FAD-dependent oxidoreductase
VESTTGRGAGPVDTEVVIIGAGFAGASLACALGRLGIVTTLVDPEPACRPTFKAEKLEPDQAALLRKLGLFDAVLPAVTPIHRVQSLRGGRVLRDESIEQYAASYEVMVNALRRAIPPSVEVVEGRVEEIASGGEAQTVSLEDGTVLRCRLAVLAAGTTERLGEALGLRRRMVQAGHSLCIGFDLARADGRPFDFDSISYYSDQPQDRFAYLTLFPIGAGLRANLFTYRTAREPWVKKLSAAPERALAALIPELTALTGELKVTGRVQARAIDLQVVDPPERAGLVLIGDAFQSVCPSTGTGLSKVLTDVDLLAGELLPRWLATPGMGVDKVAAFYLSPRKREVDRRSLEGALFQRHLALDDSLEGRLARLRFFAGLRLRGLLG